jgi:hypothetical protein
MFLYHIRILSHFKGQRLNLIFMEVVDQDGSRGIKKSVHRDDGLKSASSQFHETISFLGAREER